MMKIAKTKNFNSFLAVFPLHKPKYLILTIIDTPQKANKNEGRGAGFNAGPMAVEIITKCASFLWMYLNKL